ncbi:MAG: LytTR family DNA-binding domain-containing protein [Oscillospiraceae bacterium]|nr:LytTR family DNA-binding domain-containing protein [Oscillospiraceae bacterium]
MRIAICDDDQRERDTVERLVLGYEKTYPEVPFHISAFDSGEALLAVYRDGTNFDMLFLDIQMKDIDGIQTAQEIRKTNQHAIIFFITGFTQYISAAFTLNAFQFIVKPVKKDMFDREFRRALKKHFMGHKKYIVESDARTIALEIKDIVYMESLDHYIAVHTERNEYIKRGQLNGEEKALVPYGFVRTHRKYLVNMAYIFEITQNDMVLKSGDHLQLSARKHSEVMNSFNHFLAGHSLCSD